MINYIQKLSLLFVAVLLLGVVDTNAQDKGKVKDKMIHAMTQNQNSNGREFYVAFPYNDSKNHPTQNLAIYVTSSVDTKVTIQNEDIALNVTKNVKAFEITEFSSVKGGLGWDAEIYDFEKEIGKGLRITSPDPIAVYCMNSKSVSSEGYLAIPTNYWGKSYVHNSIYDFDEVREWAGGFCVIAQEDFTTVTIQLKDGANKARGFGETTKGSKHGDVLTAFLMEGEVYTVQGTGTTRGVFDLSGTLIDADKPIGLLSYHNRTMIPSTVVTSGRDHIIEMIPPIQAWGTEYATVEFDRKKDKGDYFRVVAGEDNVTFTIDWWTKDGTEKLSKIGPITLQEKGDWFEYNGSGATMPHNLESIRGMSYFKADGPILVCQYSYSANYDGAGGNYDPFMIVTTAVEQYTRETVFQTPQNYGQNEFRNNFFNIVAIGDPDDAANHQKIISSITIDGQRVVDKVPSFLGNRIPGTKLYWAFIDDLEAGSHHLKGETPFGGYIYGYASFDSYGWPAATSYSNLSEIDTLPPIVTFPPACFEWTINNVDDPEHERNGKEGDDPRQIDLGVRILPELLEGSFNFDDPVYVDDQGNPAEWNGIEPNYDFNYKIKVTDPYQNAKAILRVTDDAGNFTDTTIVYNVDQILSDPDPIVYGKVRVGTDRTLDVKISSGSEDPVEISDIKLKLGQVYTIDTDLSFLPFTLEPMGDTTVTITYSPIDEYIDLNDDPELQFDFDTLVVTTGCLEWDFAIDGQGVQPEIIVDDYNAGLAQVGDFTLSSTNTFDDGVLIQNFGTDTLIINGLSGLTQPFTLPNMPGANITGDQVVFDDPIIVPPVVDDNGTNIHEVLFNQDLDNKYLIRFEPFSTANADNEINVTFVSNAADEDKDEVSRWYGTAQASGPGIVPYTFIDTRVDAVSTDKGFVVIENLPANGETWENAGKIEALTGTIRLKDDNGNFSLDQTRNIQGYNTDGDLILGDIQAARVDLFPKGHPDADKVTAIRIPVEFTPLEIGYLSDAVVVDFDKTNGDRETLEGRVEGKGFIPVINVTNQKFSPIEVDQGIHPEQGRLIVKNVTVPKDGEYSDVIIQSIDLDNTSPDGAQFINFAVDGTPVADFNNNGITLKRGEEVVVTYDFQTNGAATGINFARLQVISDAGRADENGNTPVTDNDHLEVFDGNYVEDSPTGLADGGYIQGPISSSGVAAQGHDFGAVSLCDLVPATVTVRNNASGPAAVDETITGVSYIGTDPALDVYEFTIDDYQGVVLTPAQTIDVGVNFIPGTREGVYNGAEYEFIFQSGKTAPFTMDGEIIEDLFRLTLKPHERVTPGDVIDLAVAIEAVDSDYNDAKINTMNVTLRYKPEWLSYTGNSGNGNLVNWNITEQEDIVIVGGETYVDHKFTLEAPAGETVDQDGILFEPEFTYLLHSVPEGQSEGDISVVPEISNVFFGQRDLCIADETVPGLITSQFCVQNYRSIDLAIATTGDNLKAISPNPVVGSMNLNFIVASESLVNLEITNFEGRKVKTLMSGRLNAGEYDTTADVSDLPAGVYYVHYRYLGVDETQKIVITK
jgi:hypothetical protein